MSGSAERGDTVALRAALEALEAARCAWLVEPSAEGFGQYFDERLRFEHSTGRVDDAGSFREFVLSGAVDYRAVEHRLDTVSGGVWLGTATATGELRTELVKAGELKRLASSTRAEFALGPGGWRLLSLVCTPLAAVPAAPAVPAVRVAEVPSPAVAGPAGADPAPEDPAPAEAVGASQPSAVGQEAKRGQDR